MPPRPCLVLVLLIGLVGLCRSQELHVAVDGDNDHDGSAARPLRTVNLAAQMAKPGDTVVIHAGTYREWVQPARGGDAISPITYRPAAGAVVRLTGSERITTWVRQADGAWATTLPAAFFGKFNPCTLTVAGSYMTYGQWHHRGTVYCDGEAFTEVQHEAEVAATPGTWATAQLPGVPGAPDGKGDSRTRITANFGERDPNARLSEINVRPMVFWPTAKHVDHLVVQGLTIDMAATAWAPPDAAVQEGAIGTNGGAHWTIEHCTVRHSRAVGIAIGLHEMTYVQMLNGMLAMGLKVPMPALASVGHHRITANHVRDCGQAGIAGMLYCSGSTITGNLVEDINPRQEFGGWETAALKFHYSTDLVIAGNLVRGVRGRAAAYGIWIDFANVNTRITGNAILDAAGGPWLLEMNHGPLLIDGNLIIGAPGGGSRFGMFASAATVAAHNLFVDTTGVWTTDQVKPVRQAAIFAPHGLDATTVAGIEPALDQWRANVFVGRAPQWPNAASVVIDGNVYLAGAGRPGRDRTGMADALDPRFTCVSDARGLRVSWDPGATTATAAAPLLDSDTFGTFTPVGMRCENPDGSTITLDRDLLGQPRDPRHPRRGPFGGAQAALHEQVVFDATTVGAPAAR